MNYVIGYVRLSQWAFEAVILPPIFAILAVSIVGLIGGTRGTIHFKVSWRRGYSLALTHLLFFVAIVGVGTFGAATPGVWRGETYVSRPATWCLTILFYSSFVSWAFWIWRMKGLRWFAAGLVGVMQAFVVGASFVAAMSVSGDWL
jgi:hypothetical protein